MKRLSIIMLSLVIFACYKEQSTTGVYKVTTETAAEIYYTDGSGDTQMSETAGGEWIYEVELKQDGSPDPFWFTIYVISTSGIQDITIYASFEDGGYYTASEKDVEELEYTSAFCTEWSTKCSKVTIHL